MRLGEVKIVEGFRSDPPLPLFEIVYAKPLIRRFFPNREQVHSGMSQYTDGPG